ncbi:hypothetical protein LV89_00110 [Arcicella aurantiaca]|uniref:Polyketide cyclase/dehydrase/lipid transport protein n=1 Tax=Arcicella aurantiaca TaxID=591202 RepID=A0A316EFB1_9BACT|nr:hypothetical protein [Arcicella aurantiaca]PWK29270.1 hypothetical protein LV89_00110 [Arcicella aurantiaca]
MYSIIVERAISKSFFTVKNTVLDIHKYAKWWKEYKPTINTEGDIIAFSPVPFFSIELVLIELKDNSIKFEYRNAPFIGFGTWEILEINQNCTSVSYKIEIKGKSIFFDKLIRSAFFVKKHQFDIFKLINKLEYL